jgi:hypothetical protein
VSWGFVAVREAKRILRPWLKSEGDWDKPAHGTIRAHMTEAIRRHLNWRQTRSCPRKRIERRKRAGRCQPDRADREKS